MKTNPTHRPRSVAILMLSALGAAAAMAASGCAAGVLLPDAGDTGPSVFEGLPAARPVVAIASDGVQLRGAHIETDPGVRPPAPVVLHLLPAGASVRTGVPAGVGRVGLSSAIDALGRAGLSSVVFDYRGIGASEGRRDAARFLDDARAVWREAVRLAGGREDRVVIRAGSLGSLIAADLLDDGAAPAGVVLFAPVRASSVVRHAIATRHGAGWATLTSGLYRSPGTPDLEDVAQRTPVPMLIVLPADDGYLPPDEAGLVADAARDAGHTVIEDPGDHQTTVLRSWNFVVDPDGFGGRRVEALTDAELRFLAEIVPPLERGTPGQPID